MQTMLPNYSDDGQIYAYNLRGPAEKNLLYIAYSKGNLDKDWFLWRRHVDGNCSQIWKMCSRPPAQVYHLLSALVCRIPFLKPIYDDKNWIMVCLTPRQQHKEGRNFEAKIESWLLILRDCGIELQYLKLSSFAWVHWFIYTNLSLIIM